MFAAAVFGRDLEEQFCVAQEKAPWVVVKCTEELEHRARDQGTHNVDRDNVHIKSDFLRLTLEDGGSLLQ